MTEPRSRAVIEQEIATARMAVEIAEDDLAGAKDWLAGLEEELAALPDDHDERWYALRDPRQLSLGLCRA
jgi:hypothetical protein